MFVVRVAVVAMVAVRFAVASASSRVAAVEATSAVAVA